MPKSGSALHVRVEQFTGLEQNGDDVGHPYFVASCREIVAVTDGDNWNDLLRNIHEMVAASLEREDTVAVYNLVPNPEVIIMLDSPDSDPDHA